MRLAGMSVLVLLMAAPVVAAPRRDPLEARLIALEKQSWVAWQAHDTAFFSRFLSDDHVEMTAGGPTGKAVVVRGVAGGCVVKTYKLDRFRVSRLGPDAAILTYRAEQDTVCGGSAVLSPVWATSLFVRRGGRWANALYVHSPAAN
jgi:hypothetical protein